MTAPHESRVDCLSEREIEVLRLICEGLSLDDIARRLHRSVDTVKSHRRRIGRKLGVRNRVELIRIAIESGLVSLNLEASVGEHGSMLTTLERCRIPACIVDARGQFLSSNALFDDIARDNHGPDARPSLGRAFAEVGTGWVEALAVRAMESGLASETARLASRPDLVHIHACRCPLGSGPNRLLLLVDRPPAAPAAPEPSADRGNALAALLTDNALYAPDGGAFAVLLWKLAKALDASHALLLVRNPPAQGLRVRTAWSRDRGLERAEVSVDGPWAPLDAGHTIHIPDAAATLHPGLAHGPCAAARSILAVPVAAPGGAVLAALALLADRPWPDPAEALVTLRAIAARLAAELDRRQAEQDRAEQQRRFARLTELLPEGVFRADLAGGLSACNAAMTELLGLAPELCLGRGWLRAIHPEDHINVQRLIEHAAATAVLEGELRLLKPGGGERRVRVRLGSDFDALGARIGVMGTFAELPLSASPDPASTETPLPAEPFLRLSLNGVGVLLESSKPELLPSPAPPAGVNIADLVAPEEAEFVQRMLAQCLSGRDTPPAVLRLRPAPPAPLWARLRMTPDGRTPAGAVTTVTALLWDETEAWLRQTVTSCAHMGWTRAEEEYRAGRLPAFAHLEHAPVGVICTDARGRFLAANAAARLWLGLDRQALGAATVCDVRTAPGFRTGSELFAEHSSRRGGHGLVHIAHDGSVRTVRFRGHPTPCGLHVALLEEA